MLAYLQNPAKKRSNLTKVKNDQFSQKTNKGTNQIGPFFPFLALS